MKILILYGEMGSGKTYLGERVATLLHMTFLEGDDHIPPEMAERIKRFLPIRPNMIKTYLLRHLVPNIHALARALEVKVAGHGIVVAQALYVKNHRILVADALQYLGHEVEFQCIKTPFWRHMRQLWGRPNGARWVLYGLLNKPFFQA